MNKDEERIRRVANLPYLRPMESDLDLSYVNAINAAKDRVELWDLITANPGRSVVTASGMMGYVPHERSHD